MSESDSGYTSGEAFAEEPTAESSSYELQSADFEGSGSSLGVVSAEDGGTCSPSLGVGESRPSTSGPGVETEEVSVAAPGEGVLTVVGGRQRIPMAKPKETVYGVDHLEPNVLTEVELAAIRAEYHIPDSVVMRIPGPLESLSEPVDGVVFFTDVFKHGLRLPLRPSVQKVVAAIGYAPGQFNPNFWITLLGTITAFGIAEEGVPSYEQFAQLYSVTRAKSADQGGWVQSNCLHAGQRGHFVCGVPSSQKSWRKRRVLVSGAWESAPGVEVERHIPTTFQTIGRL